MSNTFSIARSEVEIARSRTSQRLTPTLKNSKLHFLSLMLSILNTTCWPYFVYSLLQVLQANQVCTICRDIELKFSVAKLAIETRYQYLPQPFHCTAIYSLRVKRHGFNLLYSSALRWRNCICKILLEAVVIV